MSSSSPILVLDVGNTRMKWAYRAGDALVKHAEAAYTVAQIPKILSKRWNTPESPSRIIVSNVGKTGVAEAISQWTMENWALQAEYVEAEHQALGVTCAYPDHATFGSDRWMALIAAYEKYKGPVCVVDCGTALTIDALGPNGKHLGGLIVPGIGSMRRALSRNTERIGNVSENDKISEKDTISPAVQHIWLGRNTREGVMAGTMWAAVAFIDRVLADLEAELRQRVRCVLAGGDAQTVHPLLTCHATCEPDLVLQGLAIVAG